MNLRTLENRLNALAAKRQATMKSSELIIEEVVVDREKVCAVHQTVLKYDASGKLVSDVETELEPPFDIEMPDCF